MRLFFNLPILQTSETHLFFHHITHAQFPWKNSNVSSDGPIYKGTGSTVFIVSSLEVSALPILPSSTNQELEGQGTRVTNDNSVPLLINEVGCNFQTNSFIELYSKDGLSDSSNTWFGVTVLEVVKKIRATDKEVSRT